MKKSLIFFLTMAIYFAACNFPNAEKAIKLMDKYWDIYQRKDYDSLTSFYSLEGDNQPARLQALTDHLRKTDEKFGRVVEIIMTKSEAGSSLGKGNYVNLEYQVRYENATVMHYFSYTEKTEDNYKIKEHTIN